MEHSTPPPTPVNEFIHVWSAVTLGDYTTLYDRVGERREGELGNARLPGEEKRTVCADGVRF